MTSLLLACMFNLHNRLQEVFVVSKKLWINLCWYLELKYSVVILGSVAISVRVLSGQSLSMATKVAQGNQDRIKGDVSGFLSHNGIAGRQLQHAEGVEGLQVLQSALHRVSFIHMGLEPTISQLSSTLGQYTLAMYFQLDYLNPL